MEDPFVQSWDDSLRKLVHADPQAFVHLVDPEAEYLTAYKEKLKPLTREVDGLLLTRRTDGKQQLIHIEIQSVNDPEMGDRMLVYHVLARTQYHLPVLSCVIYLRQDGLVPLPPHRWHAADGSVTNDFHYTVIEIANLTAGELRAFGEPGLLPLLPLTKDGASREVAEEMFVELQVVGNLDLLQIGQMIASLAFGEARPKDQEWVLRRYREMYDRLQETPVYKEMTRLATEKARAEALKEAEKARAEVLKEAEKARVEVLKEAEKARAEALKEAEEALKKARAEALKEAEEVRKRDLREMLLTLVQARFPKMSGLAKRLAGTIDQSSTLQALILKISTASSLKEARQYLLKIIEEEGSQD
jgi:hypothetical protein